MNYELRTAKRKNPQDFNSCNSIKFMNKNSCDSCNSWIKKNPQDFKSAVICSSIFAVWG
jgi:hypothetical protein